MDALRCILVCAIVTTASAACDFDFVYDQVFLLMAEGDAIEFDATESDFSASYGSCDHTTAAADMVDFYQSRTGAALAGIDAARFTPQTDEGGDVTLDLINSIGNYRVVHRADGTSVAFDNEEVHSAWWTLTANNDIGDLNAGTWLYFGVWRFSLPSSFGTGTSTSTSSEDTTEHCIYFKSGCASARPENIETLDLILTSSVFGTGTGSGTIKVLDFDEFPKINLTAREIITFPQTDPDC